MKEIDKNTLYYQALEMAFSKFIEEEKKGFIFTELRLAEAIKAARTLYK
jgi:UDP-glucose 6-dehydrogenase